LTFAMRADHIIWILTANSVDELAPSIIDRVTVFSVEQPPPDMSAGVIRLIYASVNARFGKAFNPDLRGDVVNCLLEINPRRARKVIEIAFGYAMDANREFLTLNDIQNAEAVLAEGSAKSHSFGFL
jgi:ATP-dependent Lon protease